jgi:hypothetical protein
MDANIGDLIRQLMGAVLPVEREQQLENQISDALTDIAGAPVTFSFRAVAPGDMVTTFAIFAANEDARTVAASLLEGLGWPLIAALAHPPCNAVVWTDGPDQDPGYPNGEWWAWMGRKPPPKFDADASAMAEAA